jgi:hypothetical protein
VNRFRGPDRRSGTFEFSVRAQSDLTGGPVFNDMGEVIGVISGAALASPVDGAAMASSFSHAINASVLLIADNLAGRMSASA